MRSPRFLAAMMPVMQSSSISTMADVSMACTGANIATNASIAFRAICFILLVISKDSCTAHLLLQVFH